MRGRHRLSWSTSFVALVAAGAPLWVVPDASAATITVPNGATVGQQVLADGDTLIVEQGGTIDDAGSAVDDAANGSHLTIVNNGVITGNRAVDTLSILDFTNAGVITSSLTGVGADSFARFINTGSITSVGYGVNAVTLDNVDNSGLIHSAGFAAMQGVVVGTIVNSGTLSGNGGIESLTSIGLVTNTGLIDALGYGIIASGDIGLVVNSGTITGATTAGVSTNGQFVALSNSGTINSMDGVAVAGDAMGTVANSGLIEGFTHGVRVFGGDLSVLSNSGTITGNHAVQVNGRLATITNSGTISGQRGLFLSELGLLVNSGSIIGTDTAVSALSGAATIVNSGVIQGGAMDEGIFASTLSLTNSGTIGGRHAVSADVLKSLVNTGVIVGDIIAVSGLDIVSLTNSGTIKGASPADYAFAESGANGTDTLLTLNAGSIIIGRVDISPDDDTLVVNDGLNLALTFDNSIPEIIETNGNPYAVVGTTVHVVDAAALQASTNLAAGLAGGIGGAVGTGLRQGYDELGAHGEANVWLEGFGAAGQGPAGRSLLGGIVAGADFGPDADLRIGAFAGGGRGVVAATASSAALDSLYAGIYGSAQLEGFELESVFAAGLIETDHSRTVANNTVAMGLETATATETAWFLAPQATLRKAFVTADMMWDASLTVGYTGVFSNGYVEAGSASPLDVGAGASHVLDGTALLILPYQNTQTEGGTLTADLHAGVIGTVAIADGAATTLAGAALAPAADTVAAGFTAGATFDYEFGLGATLYGGVDGRILHDLSVTATAEAGLKGTF